MRKEHLEKIKNLLQQDKLCGDHKFEELLFCDVNKVLSDYFCFAEKPTIEMYKEGNCVRVNIKILASEIRNFGILPEI